MTYVLIEKTLTWKTEDLEDRGINIVDYPFVSFESQY